MTPSRRIPTEIFAPVVWTFFLAFLWAAVAIHSKSLVSGGVALLLGLTAVALLRLRPWGRLLASVLFTLALLHNLRTLATLGYSASRLFSLGMNAWWAAYMLLPSTRSIFRQAGNASFDVPGCLSQTVTYALIAAVSLPLLLSGIPKPWALAIVVVLIFAHLILLDPRLERRIRRRMARRPLDLNDASWTAFRRALDFRATGKIESALEALGLLPSPPCFRALQGLLLLEKPDVVGPLRRIIFDADYIPDPLIHEQLATEARDPAVDVDACIQERAEVVDALLADAFSPRPLFAGEADEALRRITGRIFLRNAEYAYREAWEKQRPLCTGPQGRTWLTLRLWERQAHAAAEAVAVDPLVREVAGISRLFAASAREGVTAEWIEENAHTMVVLPLFADAFRLLYLDLPYLDGMGEPVVASRLRRRLELVAGLRRLRDEYSFETGAWTGLLLAMLAGQSNDPMVRKKRFDSWWEPRRASQAAFDTAFTRGLETAANEDWGAAATAFEEASTAWPERPCARHNRALCLYRDGQPVKAEALFAALTREEADEPLYWLRLGDARRALGRSKDALAAYRQAAKLGGLEKVAAARLGLALADEGRDEEALKELDTAAGPAPDAATLERLADFLEQEGVFGLAHHYRQKALGERLSRTEEDDEDNEELTAQGG